jgi:hypothetical protein
MPVAPVGLVVSIQQQFAGDVHSGNLGVVGENLVIEVSSKDIIRLTSFNKILDYYYYM